MHKYFPVFTLTEQTTYPFRFSQNLPIYISRTKLRDILSMADIAWTAGIFDCLNFPLNYFVIEKIFVDYFGFFFLRKRFLLRTLLCEHFKLRSLLWDILTRSLWKSHWRPSTKAVQRNAWIVNITKQDVYTDQICNTLYSKNWVSVHL